MNIESSPISGVMLGLEVVDGNEFGEKGTYVVLDLFIIRLMFIIPE